MDVGCRATTFSGPLSSGRYSLWLLDGDNPVNYKLDLQVASAAPERTTWLLMLFGVAGLGLAVRRFRMARAQKRVALAALP